MSSLLDTGVHSLDFGMDVCKTLCLDLPSPAANGSDITIAGSQPTCLDLPSPAANSLFFRISGSQPTCLDLPSPAANSLFFRISGSQPCFFRLPTFQLAMHMRVQVRRHSGGGCQKGRDDSFQIVVGNVVWPTLHWPQIPMAVNIRPAPVQCH